MAAEDFFTRWSQKKSDAAVSDLPADDVIESQPATSATDVPQAGEEIASQTAPTQEDVEKLTHDSDYSAFMADGVDESVKRSAMKKLFSNPHFNIMDGLDIYIDDYSKFEPISPALLASLSHAKNLLDPLSQLKSPIMSLLDKIPVLPEDEQAAPALEHAMHDDGQADEAAAPPAADVKKDYAESQAVGASQDKQPETENLISAEDVQQHKAPLKPDDV